MKRFLVESIGEEKIVEAILAATWRVKYYAPGLSTAVADALIQTAKRFESEGKKVFRFGFKRAFDFRVAVDVSPRAIFDGWGDAEAIKRLWCYDVEQHTSDAERWFYVSDALQIGILIADDETFLFTPLLKAKARGWNGVVSNYDLMLKEVEDDFRLSPIAKRLVSAEDIEALANAKLLTREEMETRIREMEAEIVQVRKDADAEVTRVKAEAATQVQAANTRAEEAEQRAKAAEEKLEEEKNKAAEEAIKKYTEPPVYAVELSLEKFNLERMTFKIPPNLLGKVFLEKDVKELKAALSLSKEELKNLCQDDYEEACNAIEKIRQDFTFSVSYEPPSEAFGNKKTRNVKVLLKGDMLDFKQRVDHLNKMVGRLRFDYSRRIADCLVMKVLNLFKNSDNHLTEDEVCFGLRSVGGDSKFNPRVVYECAPIQPEIYESESFKNGLEEALHVNFDAFANGKPKYKEYTPETDRGLQKLKGCQYKIEELYRQQYSKDVKVEDEQTTDSTK